MANKMILGGSGGISARGIISRTVLFLVDSEDEAMTYGPATHLGVPQKPGGRTWVPTKASKYKLTVIYEGLLEEGDPEAPENFTWLPSRSEEAIETHPEIQKLVEKYQGTRVEGKVVFPPWLAAGQGKDNINNGLPGRNIPGPAGATPNPMVGRESYLLQTGVWRWNLVTKSKPNSWIRKNGSIVKSVPGGMDTPKDHDWLVMFGPMVTRGSGDALAYESKVDFLLSEEGGFPPSQWILKNA
ncbi:MAG: hypothetical protein QM496_13960 [Verrucomicrobiota bacterium]